MLAFKDDKDGYYQYADEAPLGWYAHLTPCSPQIHIDTAQEQRDAISNAIQKMQDGMAQSLRYDSIISARSYAGYVNPFQTEAIKLANWSAACWATAGTIEAEVLAGAPLPTVAETMERMPIY